VSQLKSWWIYKEDELLGKYGEVIVEEPGCSGPIMGGVVEEAFGKV